MKKLILSCFAALLTLQAASQQLKTENVIIVTLDGFRWQELFRGADSTLINSAFTKDTSAVKKKFWAPDASSRRKMLLPFFWDVIATKGQLFGNRDLGNKSEVANPYHFSYPGYNEIFTGFPDTRINHNDPTDNPNINVLEFINKQRGFEHKVAAFTSWHIFPSILNQNRSKLLINSGYSDVNLPTASDRLKHLNEIQHKVPELLGPDIRLDFLTYEFGKAYLKQYKPRVLYLAFAETDDLAHEGNYQFYLQSAHKEDGFLKELWDYLQTEMQYKDKTTLIITCDHGRGELSDKNWISHGKDIPGSKQTWVAILGPDTPPTGMVKTKDTIYQKQLAQTIAGLLGFDFKAAAGHPAGDQIPGVFK